MGKAIVLGVVLALAPLGNTVPAVAGPVPTTSCQVFPSDNVWNADISNLPIHSRSAQWLSAMAASTTNLHPDFGGPPYGFPFNVVDNTHPTVNVSFQYASESDAGPYPVGADTSIENGSDRHALVINKSTCTLYELFDLAGSGSTWTAGSGAIFPLGSNALRPIDWTSADAAGLPIFPGLVRWDEVQAGAITHAIRFTAQQSDQSFLWPARHQAGTAANPALPPMGARFRLKAGYDISHFSSQTQVILRAMQHYGLILADNGSNWFFSGTEDANWPDSLLSESKTVPASQFEAIDESSLMIDPNSAAVSTGCRSATASGGPAPTSSANTFYFAEGFTGPGFIECLGLFTPNTTGTAQIDYDLNGGSQVTQLVALQAGRVATVNVNQAVGPNREVSAKVTLPGPGVVERTLHFTFGAWHGSTDVVGATQLATEWDFAEGSTLGFFSEYLTLQNPNATTVPATLTYMTDSGAHPSKTVVLAANSRTTVEVFKGNATSTVNPCTPGGVGSNCGVGPGIAGVSVRVTTPGGQPVVAERPFYVNGFSFGSGPIRDGHVAFGANAPATTWNFAEGTTLPGFYEYLTLQNPDATASAHVTLHYLDGTGSVTTRAVTINPLSRLTVEVFKPALGMGPGIAGVSTQVTSDLPIVAERPMYMVHDFGSGPVAGAHDVMGQTGLGTLFGFATAATAVGENDYLTIQNPNAMPANLTITYYPGTGPVTRTFSVPAKTRHTVAVFQAAEGIGLGIAMLGIVVASDQQILVEKPTYSSNTAAYGATDTAGYAAASF
ncbi:MAG: hypothetical protein AUG49_22525 [Catenulispora sp. 13_1_20CM_3_70_7]|nr:MAG: hypothetical protein AUG49_22525 [Catenulispora sp. 13_1_20CM_3_70_7]